jgi:hypothetical protein
MEARYQLRHSPWSIGGRFGRPRDATPVYRTTRAIPNRRSRGASERDHPAKAVNYQKQSISYET